MVYSNYSSFSLWIPIGHQRKRKEHRVQQQHSACGTVIPVKRYGGFLQLPHENSQVRNVPRSISYLNPQVRVFSRSPLPLKGPKNLNLFIVSAIWKRLGIFS